MRMRRSGWRRSLLSKRDFLNRDRFRALFIRAYLVDIEHKHIALDLIPGLLVVLVNSVQVERKEVPKKGKESVVATIIKNCDQEL